MDESGKTVAARRAAWVASVAVALVVGALTLSPSPPNPGGLLKLDKLNHVLAFAALTMPLAAVHPRLVLRIFVIAMAYGLLIEVVQPFADRSRSAGDLVADAVGCVLGCGAAGSRPGFWRGAA